MKYVRVSGLVIVTGRYFGCTKGVHRFGDCLGFMKYFRVFKIRRFSFEEPWGGRETSYRL